MREFVTIDSLHCPLQHVPSVYTGDTFNLTLTNIAIGFVQS